ncbi:protein FUN34 [Suhomyces tanzawaensis NRRL Y-17324]|uniref:Protein FUN34 n=1 Tax=Suhomyces tanzawaensis NRRL Y-17324 TaxID=984487 RepID=A0A1E4SCA2_9ASCO|nr:protein FUN34 [Suhomyces tanzawaensis NRRL Y-17324]ODV77022.1 protein FUN34 [Suhomyces tanzawaensis NRRL Y-17324]
MSIVENRDTHSDTSNKSIPTTVDQGVGRIHVHGDSHEYVTIGNQRFWRHELMQAFGGSLTVGATPYPKININPAPVGLSAFAFTTFVLSMCNAQAMGIKITNVAVGAACFYGGLVQIFAGVAEFFAANTFGATALCSYGAFWLSFAAINIPAFGIGAAYKGDEEMLENAVGFFLTGWAIFTFMLVLLTLKSTVAFCALFLMLCLTFILLAAGAFTGNVGVHRAGGVTGVITAFLGWYNAFAGTATKQNSYFIAHPIALPGNVLR